MAIVMATLCVAVMLWQIREGVVLFLVSLAVAAALRPTVDSLVRNHWPKLAALLVTYFTGIVLLAGLLVLISNPLVDEVQRASNAMLTGYEQLTGRWVHGTLLERALADRLPPPAALGEILNGERRLTVAQAALGITWNLFENVIRVILVLVLSMYWSLDRAHFERLWLSMVSGDRRADMREMWHDMEHGVGAYIRSELVQAIFAGLLLGIGFRLLGLGYVHLLAVLGAVAFLLPWVGVVIALVPACLVGLTISVAAATGAGLYALAIFWFLEWIVEPRLFNSRRYNSLLAALLALALVELLGLVGLIVGPAIAVALQIYFGHWLRHTSAAPEFAFDLAGLETRIAAMRSALAQNELPPPELISMLDRLSALVKDSSTALEPQGATTAA